MPRPTREFHLGDLITVTDGHLCSPRRMDGVYAILNFLTGDNLMTHQLPMAMRTVSPYLYEEHPFLKDISCPDGLGNGVIDWLSEQVTIYGAMHQVTALDPLVWGPHNAIEDLVVAMSRNRG